MEKELIEKINNMPKVELHLHLDGSIPIEYVKKKYNLTDEQVKAKMIASEKCKNLNDYLTCFDFPISIMQTKAEIIEITIELLKELKAQNIVYAEIRFAPQFHTKKGLTQEEVIKAVIEAKNKVDIASNIILCVMRGKDNMNKNFETLNLAKKYLQKGVCAIDLAGAEAIYNTKEYKNIFEKAVELGVPFTVHAGEADGAESVRSAIGFGTKRIGHGVRAIEDDNLLEYIKNNEITLEVCPTSNIQTCICDSYATHPIYKLFKAGILVTINTDNMTVSNTTLSNEYINIIESTNITYEDIVNMNKNSVNAAFISKEEKEELLRKYWGNKVENK